MAGLDSAGAVAVSELQAAHGLDSHRRLDTVPHTDGQLVGDSALHDIIVYTDGIWAGHSSSALTGQAASPTQICLQSKALRSRAAQHVQCA